MKYFKFNRRIINPFCKVIFYPLLKLRDFIYSLVEYFLGED